MCVLFSSIWDSWFPPLKLGRWGRACYRIPFALVVHLLLQILLNGLLNASIHGIVTVRIIASIRSGGWWLSVCPCSPGSRRSVHESHLTLVASLVAGMSSLFGLHVFAHVRRLGAVEALYNHLNLLWDVGVPLTEARSLSEALSLKKRGRLQLLLDLHSEWIATTGGTVFRNILEGRNGRDVGAWGSSTDDLVYILKWKKKQNLN